MRTLKSLVILCTCLGASNALLAQALIPDQVNLVVEACDGAFASDHELCVELAPLPSRVDVVLAVSLDSNAATSLADFKAQIGSIITSLETMAASASSDLQIALVSGSDYDGTFDAGVCGGGKYGTTGAVPFRVDAPIGSTSAQIQAAAALLASDAPDAVDGANAHGRVLWEVAQSDSGIGLRSGSARVLVFIGYNVPHDCDLNEGSPSPIFLPLTGIDPGRDEVLGTSDDIDWQDDALAEFIASGARLAYLTAGPFFVTLDAWQTWAGQTGGYAEDVSTGLTTQIPAIVAQVYAQVDEVSLVAGACAAGISFDVNPITGPIDVSAGASVCVTESITVSAGSNVGTIDCVVDVFVDGAAHGQQSVHIDVVDTILPVITCPADLAIEVDCSGGSSGSSSSRSLCSSASSSASCGGSVCGAAVFYETPTATDACGILSIVCTPESGSFFELGAVQVTCVATDLSGNTSECSFTVTVSPAPFGGGGGGGG